MDVFALRDRLVADYEEITRSIIHVRDDRIREVVDRELAEGLLWPESLIQLNPSFQPGAWVVELAERVSPEGWPEADVLRCPSARVLACNVVQHTLRVVDP